MDFVQKVLEILAAGLRAVWPGAMGAAVVGYFGWSKIGMIGFLVGAAVGALAGTWAGNKFGFVPVRGVTGSNRTDLLLYALAAFSIVAFAYFLLQFAILLAAIAAVVVLVLFWYSA